MHILVVVLIPVMDGIVQQFQVQILQVATYLLCLNGCKVHAE